MQTALEQWKCMEGVVLIHHSDANSLPSNFISSPSIPNFKRLIRSHFFTSFW